MLLCEGSEQGSVNLWAKVGSSNSYLTRSISTGPVDL